MTVGHPVALNKCWGVPPGPGVLFWGLYGPVGGLGMGSFRLIVLCCEKQKENEKKQQQEEERDQKYMRRRRWWWSGFALVWVVLFGDM